MIRRVGALLSAALLSGAAVLVTAPTAVAATGEASGVSTSDGQIRLIFEATGTDEVIDPNTVELTLDGQTLESDAVPASDAGAAGFDRKAMLVIDTSSSMNRNERLDDAKQAATTFVNGLPSDVRVGLVSFDSQARTVVRPTEQHDLVLTAIEDLTAQGNTAIYDGVRLAARELGDQGSGSVLLLTDGDEKGSSATQEQATSALAKRDLRLDAVAFQSNAGLETLQALAGSGEVLTSADSAELETFFQGAADRLSRQVLVTADIPTGVTGQVQLAVSGKAGPELVTASALGFIKEGVRADPTFDAAPGATVIPDRPWLEPWFVWVAVAVFFLGLTGVVAFAVNAAVPAKKHGMSKQLSVYTLNRGKAKEQKRERTAFGESNVAQTAVDFAGRLTAKRGLEETLQRRLDAGAVPLKPAEWILIQAAILLLVPVFAWLLSGGNLVILIVATVLAAVGPFMFLAFKESRRRKKFVDSLPETLSLMSGSLTAGYSLPQAVDSVVRDGQDPVATEFNRALVETRLGVPVEDALETISDRMRSKDWAWVVMAIRIQREVGGNLAELLLTVAGTLRERARIRRQIQTLSAEGRLSAWILGGLPIAFTLYLLVSRPDYILTLTKEPLGWLLIVGGLILMTVGGLWMKKVIDVEV